MTERSGYDVEAIRAANPLLPFLSARGVLLKRQGAVLKGRCPFHHEQHGEALTVWEAEGKWRCFGKCDAGGDVIEALMRLDELDFRTACERLGGRASESLPPPRAEPVKAKPKAESLTPAQAAKLAAAARALGEHEAQCAKIAKRRGWLVETVRGLALDGHLGLHEGKLAFLYGHGLKLRWQEKGERRISWAFGGNHELWRADRLALPQVRRVIVCEGETDAVCLLDAGLESDADVAVVAIPGASCWRPEWHPLLHGRDVLVATDADEAGKKAAARITAALAGVAARVARLHPLALLPEDRRGGGAKDIGDAHERRGREELRAALAAAIPAALDSAQVEGEESTESAELPTMAGHSADFADYAPEDSAQDEPFPLNCLPGVAGEMARQVVMAALVPDVLAGMNVLGIVSAAIGPGLEVNSGGDRRTRGNLYLMPVAASGTGKGQSHGAIAEPFQKREAARLEEWRQHDRPEACANKAIAEARLAKLTTTAKGTLTAEQKADLLRELKECHAEIERAERNLREPAWSTEQATKEAIESLFATSTRETLASLSDEARGAVDVLMGRYRESTDESIFCQAYSGGPVKIHRKGSPPVVLARPCLALLWALQPDKLRELLESPAMSDSGLMPRFLIADTKAQPQKEPEERHCIDERVKTAWAALIDDLLDTYHEPDAKAHTIQPEPEAAKMLREYRNEIVDRMKSDTGGDLADVSIYAARWAENAWRLCVVLHAALHGEDAWRENLAPDTAAKALRLMRWFSEQQLRLLAAGREDKLTKRLEKLRELLALKPERQCNLSELERRHAFTPAEVQRLAAQFPGVLVIEKLSTGGSGRPPVVARLLPEPKPR
ncbi:MAG: DUF3987 domain-containing protein [Verrucomicrobiaceae bacterium]